MTRRVFTALPSFAVDEAYLAALRRINPVKAYPLARHFLGIAINDPGGAGHIGQGGATGFTRLSFSAPSPAAAPAGSCPPAGCCW